MKLTPQMVGVQIRANNDTEFKKHFFELLEGVRKEFGTQGNVNVALYFSKNSQYYYVVFEFLLTAFATANRSNNKCLLFVKQNSYVVQAEHLDQEVILPADVLLIKDEKKRRKK